MAGDWESRGLNNFKEVRCNVRKAVRMATNIWFQEKAEQIKRERFGGK